MNNKITAPSSAKAKAKAGKKIKLRPFAKSMGFDQDSIEFFVRQLRKQPAKKSTKKG